MSGDAASNGREHVPADTLTDAQLVALLGNWSPDTVGQSPRPLLLAATRNRYRGGMVPRELVTA